MFKEKLKKTIDMMEITQKKFAEMTGCSNAAISQYLSGLHEPSKSKKRMMAKRLGLDEDYFFDIIPIPVPSEKDGFLTVAEVAKMMGRSPNWVKQGLIDDRLDFGYAVKMKRWDFCIPQELFRRKTGIDPEDPGKVYNVPVPIVAAALGKSDDFIRKGLIEGRFPWGYSVHINKWIPWISSKRFEEETGVIIPTAGGEA